MRAWGNLNIGFSDFKGAVNDSCPAFAIQNWPKLGEQLKLNSRWTAESEDRQLWAWADFYEVPWLIRILELVKQGMKAEWESFM